MIARPILLAARSVTGLFWITAAAAVLSLAASSASAGLVVTVGSIGMLPTGTEYVDVFVRSDTGADVLDLFSLEFEISSSNGGEGLKFTDPVPDPDQSQPLLTDPGYLFVGNSAIATLLPDDQFLGSVTPEGHFIGGDGTTDGNGVLVPMTDTLLMRLQVFGDPPAFGAIFQLTPEDPQFFAPGGGDVPLSQLTGGDVTILPEPASVLTLGGLLACCGLSALYRRKS